MEAIVKRRNPLNTRVLIFGVGHKPYWSQYPGLFDELTENLKIFEDQVQSNGCEVCSGGIVDDAESAYALSRQIAREDPDLVFCDLVTYATSATWGIVVRETRAPIVLVALQPDRALDYPHATIYRQLVNDPVCALPEFTGVALRIKGNVPPAIIGLLHNDERTDLEIRRWCSIGHVLHDLRGARIGHIGHTLESMLDMNFDATSFTAGFGIHVAHFEVGDVLRHYRAINEAAVAEKSEEIVSFFDTPDPVSDPDTMKLTEADLSTASRAYAALEGFIDEKHLDGLAYYYEGEEGSDVREMVSSFIVGNSLLTAGGFPMCGESDMKTCVAMLIFDRLGIGGSFAEIHPVDFDGGFILVGHDGPHHINISDGKPVIRSLKQYHGKPGSGASVEFKLKTGPVTLMSIGQKADGTFKFVIAEGKSVPGPIPATGNTNTRVVFASDPVTFLHKWIAAGPTHHFALGTGSHADTLLMLAGVLGIDAEVVMRVGDDG